MESERLENERQEKEGLEKEESARIDRKTRRCVKNADASAYCDPEKDCREKSLKSDWTNLKLLN